MHPSIHLFLLALVSAVCSSLAQTAPAKLSNSARIDLVAEPGVLGLAGAEIPGSNGTVERMNWLSEADRARSYTVQFPITHFAWSECALRFVPEGSGSLTLSLMGPWEEASQGVLYREEVLWDALRVSGASVASAQKW